MTVEPSGRYAVARKPLLIDLCSILITETCVTELYWPWIGPLSASSIANGDSHVLTGATYSVGTIYGLLVRSNIAPSALRWRPSPGRDDAPECVTARCQSYIWRLGYMAGNASGRRDDGMKAAELHDRF